KKDPLEKNNIAEENKDIVDDMRKKLMAVLHKLEHRNLGDYVTGDDENIKLLERLDYIRTPREYYTGMLGMTV
ncbi:MAG: hypothetical protein DRJ34_05430, partial [Thermoprotei archaeon]